MEESDEPRSLVQTERNEVSTVNQGQDFSTQTVNSYTMFILW